MFDLLTNEAMRRADAAAIRTGTPGIELMQRAGEGVARAAEVLFARTDRPIVILCGPGNNGGDGFVAGQYLKTAGWTVRLGLLGEPALLGGDAARAAQAYEGAIEPLRPDLLNEAGGIIDALFGSGLTRPLAGQAAEMVAAINASGLPVLAVDVPSGVDSDTGQVRGCAVKATRTITFFRYKPGHFLYPGRALCGARLLIQIGVGQGGTERDFAGMYINRPPVWRSAYPVPAATGHKYGRGHAGIVSGGRWAGGAARLAARAALRIGAGLVSIAAEHEAADPHAAQLNAVMLRLYDETSGVAAALGDARINAVLIGPGAGVNDVTHRHVLSLLESEKRLVLDADALVSFEAEPQLLFDAITRRDEAVVMTPHDGEYARLFKDYDGDGDRLSRARFAARRSGAIVILKGADTVVAVPDGRAAINDSGVKWLATAGSGDVLAGIVTGLLAQGMATFEAACAAVYLHGLAGRSIGPGLIAEDLPEQLPALLGDLLGPDATTADGPDMVSFLE